RGEGEHRCGGAREEWMPAEANGEWRIAGVFNGKGHGERVVGELEDLSRWVRIRPFARALAGRGVHELERCARRCLLDHLPRTAPPVAVDRMRVTSEITRKQMRGAPPVQRRVADAIGKRNQRIG